MDNSRPTNDADIELRVELEGGVFLTANLYSKQGELLESSSLSSTHPFYSLIADKSAESLAAALEEHAEAVSCTFIVDGNSLEYLGLAKGIFALYSYEASSEMFARELIPGWELIIGRFFSFDGHAWLASGKGANKLIEKDRLAGKDIIAACSADGHPNYRCNAALSGKPAVAIETRKAMVDMVELSVASVVKASRLSPISGLGHLAFDGMFIRRIMPEQTRKALLGSEQKLMLTGSQIPAYALKFAKQIKRYGDNATKKYFAECIADPKSLKLVLSVERAFVSGVGVVYAKPALTSQKKKAMLPEAITNADGGFVDLGGRWAKLEDAIAVGASDKLPARVEISSWELLCRGSPRLQSPWQGLSAPLKEWQVEASDGLAAKHLEFLRSYGINGASCAVSASNGLISYIHSLRYAGAKALLLGPASFINSLEAHTVSCVSQALPYEGYVAEDSANYDIILLAIPESPEAASALGLIKSQPSRLRLAWIEKPWAQAENKEGIIQALNIDTTGGPESIAYYIRNATEPLSLPPGDDGYSLVGSSEIPPSPAGAITQPAQAQWERGPVKFFSSGALDLSYARFAEEAKAYEARTQASADMASFSDFMPTYSRMSEKQLKWHFYWRGKARNGQFIDTDLAYIYLFIYEIINKAGYTSPIQGLSLLAGAYTAYKARYSALAKQLPGWILDFLIINELDTNTAALELASEADGLPAMLYLKYKALYVDSSEPLSQLDLLRLSSYNPMASRFLANYPESEGISEIVASLNALDRYIRQKEGVGIIEKFMPGVKETFTRTCYTGAVFAESAKYSIEYYPIATDRKLKSFIGDGIRHAENSIRANAGYNRMLQESFSASYRGEITRYFENPPAPFKVDAEDVSRLRAESEKLKAMLLTDEEKPAQRMPAQQAPAKQALGGMKSALKSLSDEQLVLLLSIIQGKGDIASASGMHIDAINEAFVDNTGDILIDGDTVASEYSAEIMALLDEAEHKEPQQ